MSEVGRVRVLGCPVDVLTLSEAADRLADLVDAQTGGGPKIAVTLNPEMVMRAQREADFAAIVADAALVTADGIGLVRAIRRRGSPAERVAGVELVDDYFDRAVERGHRVALVGGGDGVVTEAAERYLKRHPGLIVSIADPGDPTAATAARVADTNPDIVLAAYGPGKQERFLRDHLADMGARAGMGVGGTFDFAAGRTRRAPQVVRRAGMEWAWRLALEPSRLRRQLALPRFWLLERREQRQIK